MIVACSHSSQEFPDSYDFLIISTHTYFYGVSLASTRKLYVSDGRLDIEDEDYYSFLNHIAYKVESLGMDS